MKIRLLSLLLLIALASNAQQVPPVTSVEIYHEIAQLRNLANVLYLAAHPDDENTRLLAWLVNDQHIRTGYLSLTRGDGGQNIIGSEQGAALGLIRTHELMEARALDGAEQYFARAIDFGFSKTSDETFKHWKTDVLTGDVVWNYRRFRPDVVICRFPPNAQAGHGQHAASAILAEKAFVASGDPSQFKEQLRHYPAWQPKRILLNTYRFGDRGTMTDAQYGIRVGQYNPGLGMGYGELAGKSRSIHKSQGAGTPSVAGVQPERFILVDGEPFSKSIFDGIDMTWNRVGRKDIGDEIGRILTAFDYRQPDKSLSALLELRKKISEVKDTYWRTQKLAELDRVILHSTGFLAELFGRVPEATPGTALPCTLQVLARASSPIVLKEINWNLGGMRSGDSANVPNAFQAVRIEHDSLLRFTNSVIIPAGTPPTEPYWLAQESPDNYHFAIPADTLLGLPETPNRLNAVLTLSIAGQDFQVPVPLSFKKLDPTRGDVVEQLRVVPEATVSFTQALLIPKADGSLNVGIRIRANQEVRNGTLYLGSSKPINQIVEGVNLHANSDTIITVKVPATEVAKSKKEDFYLMPSFSITGTIHKRSQHLIRYEHIPTLQYFTDPFAKVLHKNWTCSAKKIGFVEGAGDYTVEFLRLAGLEVEILKDADFTDVEKLRKYDAIVTGIRAANTEKKMAFWLPVLHRYMAQGGTLIMQYNTPQDISTTKLGPYPFTLSRDRVTEEDAAITFLQPQHRLMTFPNKITQEDFRGWVQERGLYYLSDLDPKYVPLFEMNDTGEQSLKGGTVYARHGKGHYIYTSLAFFRQLPAGNKGAIRLLMNMLSVGTKTSK